MPASTNCPQCLSPNLDVQGNKRFCNECRYEERFTMPTKIENLITDDQYQEMVDRFSGLVTYPMGVGVSACFDYILNGGDDPTVTEHLTPANRYRNTVNQLLDALSAAEDLARDLRTKYPPVPVPDDTFLDTETSADSLWHEVFSYTHDGDGIILPEAYTTPPVAGHSYPVLQRVDLPIKRTTVIAVDDGMVWHRNSDGTRDLSTVDAFIAHHDMTEGRPKV